MSASRPLPFLQATVSRGHVSAWHLLLLNLVVAAAYLAAGYAGLKLAFVGHVVTLFWPPSGIAFAAVWLGGFRLLPGVGLGAFVVNLIVSSDPVFAVVVACGSMAAPAVATFVLRAVLARHEHAGALWGELRRVLLFILAALGSTTISATAGTLALVVTGNLADLGQSTWLVWWLGDAMGILIVVPPILLWRRTVGVRPGWRDLGEIGLLAGAAGAILTVPLWLDEPLWASELGKLCALLLCLLAGARFGLNGPAWMMLLIATGTIGVTLLGAGPYQRGNFYDNFALVHSHLFTVAIAGMLLAATLADLRQTIRLEMQARAAAEDAASSRVRLLTTISHDVRTPLSGMLTVLQTLERAAILPEQGRLVGLGLRAGRTLTTLVTDILEAARADAGRITLVVAPFSPVASLADIVDFSRPAADAKGVAIHLSCAGRLPEWVSGDRVRFEQLVGNLCVNAVAYTMRGSVGINADWDDLGGGLVVDVVDTGPGIDPARLPRLFEAFAFDDRPAGSSAGLGLGLHISRRLAELMGGSLDYAPQPAGGSRFHVVLPLSAAASAPSASQLYPDPALRILVVEDDEIAGETTCALLQSHGHDTVLVAEAATAMGCAAREAFGLVLLDLRLDRDGSSGFDIVRAIRSLPGANGRVCVVALTGDGMTESHAALEVAGFDGVIVKPLITRDGIAALVEAARWAPTKGGVIVSGQG